MTDHLAPQGRDARERLRGEHGTSLMELVVAMGLAVLLCAMLLVTVVGFDHSVVTQDRVATASEQVRRAVMQLDKQVRYADAVNTPAGTSGTWWVEYDWLKATTDGPQAWCSQWRAGSDGLQEREWSTADGYATATPWKTLVFQLDVSRNPFALVTGSSLTAQQLTVTVSAPAGATDVAKGAVATTQVTLSALNSPSNAAPTAPVCQAPTSRTS